MIKLLSLLLQVLATQHALSASTIFSSSLSCEDDADYLFGKRKDKSCFFVWRQEEGKRNRLCQKHGVLNNCPYSCGLCCGATNDDSFTTSINGIDRNCAWFGKREKRKKFCKKILGVNRACAQTCNHCKVTDEPSSMPVAPPPSNLDPHGITMIYASKDYENPQSFTQDDWVSEWETYTEDVSLTSSFQVDPNDNRVVLRGNGDIMIAGDGSGELLSEISPRVYISAVNEGWENVEFTVYGNYTADYNPSSPSSISGLTLAARSSHSTNADYACEQDMYARKTCSPCNAVGYYTRIYRAPGEGKDEVMFQKEYYHNQDSNVKIYTATRRTSFFPDSVLPINEWVGMKFIVYTIPGTTDVKLELYYDNTDGLNGGNWTLIHEFVDSPTSSPWLASGGNGVPPECTEVPNGASILGPRDDCFIRSDSSYVLWKKASVRSIGPGVLLD